MSSEYKCSVIIPAHNEASTIERCLRPLAAASGEFEVIVSCNGCTDETATRAAAFSGVEVLELPVASKAVALRAGDEAATAYPRIYLDADVSLSADALRAVVGALRSEGVHAARPPIRYVTSGAAWAVRQYYAARIQLPSVMNSLWGAGCYALSKTGRQRFSTFPDAIGDDLWIDGLFERSEIAIPRTDPVDVFVPKRVDDLIAILSRAQRGKHDLGDSRSRDRVREVSDDVAQDLRRLACRGPRPATQTVVYASFAVAARRRMGRSNLTWERDESSRAA